MGAFVVMWGLSTAWANSYIHPNFSLERVPFVRFLFFSAVQRHGAHDAQVVRHQGGREGFGIPTDHRIPGGVGGDDRMVQAELATEAGPFRRHPWDSDRDPGENRHPGHEREEGQVRNRPGPREKGARLVTRWSFNIACKISHYVKTTPFRKETSVLDVIHHQFPI